MIVAAIEYLSLAAAARRVPGGGVDQSTMYRWGTRGLRGHKLRIFRRGGRLFTTAAWLEEFLEKLNGESGAEER